MGDSSLPLYTADFRIGTISPEDLRNLIHNNGRSAFKAGVSEDMLYEAAADCWIRRREIFLPALIMQSLYGTRTPQAFISLDAHESPEAFKVFAAPGAFERVTNVYCAAGDAEMVVCDPNEWTGFGADPHRGRAGIPESAFRNFTRILRSVRYKTVRAFNARVEFTSAEALAEACLNAEEGIVRTGAGLIRRLPADIVLRFLKGKDREVFVRKTARTSEGGSPQLPPCEPSAEERHGSLPCWSDRVDRAALLIERMTKEADRTVHMNDLDRSEALGDADRLTAEELVRLHRLAARLEAAADILALTEEPTLRALHTKAAVQVRILRRWLGSLP